MSIIQALKKFSTYEEYFVAYRYLKNTDNPGINNKSAYTLLKLNGFSCTWCADPFPFDYQGKHYIFVEYYSYWVGRGKIGYFCLEDSRFHLCLEEPFHLSYPNVFQWENDIYMIPETSSAKQLRLYKCTSFPDKWTLDTILLNNDALVDASLLFKNEHVVYIEASDISNKTHTNRFFVLDMRTKKIEEIQQSRASYLDKRPAGNFFNTTNGIYHALQECSRIYGEYMHICKVDSYDNCQLVEHEEKCLSANMYTFTNSSNTFTRTHTLNRSCDLEVIDVNHFRSSFTYSLLTRLWRKTNKVFKLVKSGLLTK